MQRFTKFVKVFVLYGVVLPAKEDDVRCNG
jgi:hypothetical protein